MSFLDTASDDEFKKKFKNYKQSHLLNVANRLATNYRTAAGSYISDCDYLMSRLEKIPPHLIFDRLYPMWNLADVRYADKEVKDSYKNGERFYKRGRPRGAKNKPKDDNEAIDALRELGISDNTDDMSNDELLRQLTNDASKELDKHNNASVKSEARADTINTDIVRQIIAENMRDFIAAYGRDKEELRRELELHTGAILESAKQEIEKRFSELKPNIIELKVTELETINLGVQHKNFEKLLKICSAKLRNGSHNNVWVYGPAGTGKSTAAEMVAKALKLDYYTDGKMADETKVTGYKDANGTYHTTNFRQAFEFGGVYLADEIDGSMPDALLALNGALANGHCSFPDKLVARHENFIFIAAANTTGTGGTVEYVGRFKQDAAFNDRFVFLEWPLDEALEDSLVANKTWLETVRHVRRKITSSTIKGHLITPRASIYGESLLAAGLDYDSVCEMVLKKGLTQAQWDMIRP